MMESFFVDLGRGLIAFAGRLLKIFLPVIIGLVLAYLLNGPVSYLEKKFKSRGLSILLTYACAIAVLGALVCGFVILIVGAFPSGGFTETIDYIKNYCGEAIDSVCKILSAQLPGFADFGRQEILEMLQNRLFGNFSVSSLMGVAHSVAESLVTVFVALVASVYLLKDKEFFLMLWGRFLSLTMKQRPHGIICETASEIGKVLSTFVKAALLDSLMVSFLSALALSLLRVSYAPLIGILAGLLNIIPYFGPVLGIIPAFFAAFFSGGIFRAVAAAVALVLVQQIDSNYIYPKIVGEATGLHPLFVLLSVSIMGSLFGIAGMLLAVPAAGIAAVFIRRWCYSKE